MSGIAGRIGAVRERIARACAAAGREPGEVELLAVSKKHPLSAIRAAYAGADQRAFGENRVQELTAKVDEIGDDASLDGLTFDFIGSLQTNKVAQLLAVGPVRLRMLHSLDRPKLADKLQQALATDEAFDDHVLRVLVQIHATDEERKHGIPPGDAVAFARNVETSCPSLRIEGVMAMGPLGGDPVPVFAAVAELREEIATALGRPLPVLSLGMTDDLEQAVAAGSTMVRVGTAVFGPRPAAV